MKSCTNRRQWWTVMSFSRATTPAKKASSGQANGSLPGRGWQSAGDLTQVNGLADPTDPTEQLHLLRTGDSVIQPSGNLLHR